jgi:lipoate-protein ligase A
VVIEQLPPVKTLRLLIDPPADGVWNMAVDEVLLEDAAAGISTLRFYHWDQATVSLGYFQSFEDRRTHAASLACPLVRRASGGGAILHDRAAFDVTYSVAIPAVPRRQAAQLALYELFHGTFVRLLAQRGVESRMCEEGEAMRRPQSFLCFQRHTTSDVLVGRSKVLGSAQRRSGDGLLQHGSVLLRQSDAAPELAGILEQSGACIEPEWLIPRWLDQLAEAWKVEFREAPLSDGQRQRAEQISREKFGNPQWTQRR